MRPSPKSLTRRPINSAAEPHGRTAAGSLDQNDSVATNGPEIGARAAASAPDRTSQANGMKAGRFSRPVSCARSKRRREAWRRDEETGQAYSLKLTDAGLKAIAADERGSQSIPSSVRPENPIPSAFCRCASSSLLATSVYFSPSSRRPSVTVLVTSLPSRTTTTSTDLPREARELRSPLPQLCLGRRRLRARGDSGPDGRRSQGYPAHRQADGRPTHKRPSGRSASRRRGTARGSGARWLVNRAACSWASIREIDSSDRAQNLSAASTRVDDFAA